AFNGKSRNTSLFTYNLQKESHEQLLEKLREKVVDFFSFYSEFNNKDPIKNFEAYSSDFICQEGCKIDINSKLTVVGVIYSKEEVLKLLKEEAQRFGLIVSLES
ncbi:MAG: hypothetical protein WCY48_05995, partial [Candidatus Caldatribacteriota bacterium]